MANDEIPRIVIVDDDPADTYIMQRALAHSDTPVDVELLMDGQAFLDFYAAVPHRSQPSRHQLVLLDVNMPVLNGFDALRALKEMGTPHHTPIIMFSTSSEPDDVSRAYNLGVNGYVKKPSSIEDANLLAVALNSYWLKQNIVVA